MKDFAKQIGVSFPGYQNYEYGERVPPGPVLTRIAELCGVSVDWILTGQEAGADRVAQPDEPYLDDLSKKIVDMLQGMNKEQKREALRFIEGQKLLADREKKLKEGA